MTKMATMIGLFFVTTAYGFDSPHWSGNASLEFHATTTLKDFSGTAEAEPFAFYVERDGLHATIGGTAVVRVARMETGHRRRDANMRDMLEHLQFPAITGVLPSVRIATTSPAEAPLILSIRERPLTVPAQITHWRETGDAITFDLETSVSLSEAGLSPPSVLGAIRVGDIVQITGRVRLTRPSAGEPESP